MAASNWADDVKTTLPVVVSAVLALSKAAFSRDRTGALDARAALAPLSEHRLVALRKPLRPPARPRQLLVALKMAWYLLGLLSMAFSAVTAAFHLSAKADITMLVLSLPFGVVFLVSLVNSWPNRSRRRPERWDASLCLTGDRAWIGWACESAVRSAKSTPRLLDFTDPDRGWVAGVSREAGDFLGGRTFLAVSYAEKEPGTWEVAVVADATRWSVRFTWGRTSRAFWRACDWLEHGARAEGSDTAVQAQEHRRLLPRTRKRSIAEAA